MLARAFLVLLFLACAIQPRCASAAEPARVTPALVCAVQRAIRFHEPAWAEDRCERVAAALSATPNPRQMAAICTNESDMRSGVVVKARPGVYDVGLCGVRCVCPKADYERWARGEMSGKEAADVTACRCQNGPARGYSLAQMRDPAVNVRVAAAVLATKGGHLGRYNGATTAKRGARYAARIAAIEAAFGGRAVKVAARETRLRKLVRQIVAAVRAAERKS